MSLRSSSQRTKSLVLEIFGAVCLIPGGHEPVLESMNDICEIEGYRFRFEIVVNALWQSCRGLSPQEKELQVASMSFINAVICGGPGREMEFRMHIRWEFIELGIMHLIDKIGHIENELLQTQIDVFISGMESDEADIYRRLDVDNFDTNNISEISETLTSVISQTSGKGPFSSILQHILLLPINPSTRYEWPKNRYRYLQLIAKVVQQFSVQKSGYDPDPLARLATIDLRNLIEEVIEDSDETKLHEAKLLRQLEKTKRIEKDMGLTKPKLDEKMILQELKNLLKDKLSGIDGGKELMDKIQSILTGNPADKSSITPRNSY